MGLGAGLFYWHGVKMPRTPCCADLQPWTFFTDSCITTYDSLITDGHSWWNSSTSQFYLWGESWPQTPTCGCPMPQLRPVHRTPLSGPWSGHRWHGLSAESWTGGPAWKHWWIFSLVPLSAGHSPTCDRGAPWRSQGFPWSCLAPMSSMVEDSAPRSHLGEGSCQPQWMARSCSFCPIALVWANILYIMNSWCGPRGGHLRHSSKNTSASRYLSASLTEMPTSWASFLVAVVFTGWVS